MSDKGGKKSKENSVDLKMILTAIVGVLLGAIFVLSLILTGAIVSERYREVRTQHAQGEKITDVVAISYDAKHYSYKPTVDKDEAASEFSSLLQSLGSNKSYYLIESQSDYEKVVSALASLGAEISVKDFENSEKFFYSGSIVLVTAEMHGLSSFVINSITRNENYNLRIDVTKADANDTIDVAGEAYLIKIPNIQPADVEIIRREV